MLNPILSQLNKTPNLMLQRILEIKSMLTGKDPQAMFNSMLQTNPQFAQFVSVNRGKSIEQIAQNYGIDINTIQNLIK